MRATSRKSILIKVPSSSYKKNENRIPLLPQMQTFVNSLETSKVNLNKQSNHLTSYKNDLNTPIVFDGPKTNAEVIRDYRHLLTEREEIEIQSYPEIYYIRPFPSKSRNSVATKHNIYIFETDEHIAFRFQQLQVLNHGYSGSVIKCHDHKTQTKVAIKMLRNTYKYHDQILLEKEYLRALQKDLGPENHHIIRCREVIYFRDHIGLVMELAGVNIYSVLTQTPFRRFTMATIQMIARQTAEALKFVHSKNIIHSDIKPENILFTNARRRGIKLIDFGCSCLKGNTIFTYIQSRFYRAPEVVLENPYDVEIDIWSYGCLLVEIYTGKVLFEAEDEDELIMMIISLIGLPHKKLIKHSPRANNYFDEDGIPLRPYEKKSLKDMTGIDDRYLLDLISQCLKWNPKERLTASQIIHHQFFKQSYVQHNPTHYMRT